ncbi:MAG: propionate catabolism operon regulatory protein PrpR [Burkholderiales bacterium]|nr:propionate catabolism operon regulatory protein PrpR [Burkholderiales bacterium]
MKRDPSLPPQIVAVGFRRINKMLQDLAPTFHTQAHIEVVDVGFDNAVARVRELQALRPIDVVVAAGSNGGYLRQHLDTPVVLVKVGGFDVLQALAHAKRLSASVSAKVGLVTYEGMIPDLSGLHDLLTLDVVQRTYRTEEEARLCVQELRQMGIDVVVGSGAAADCADDLGLVGVFLYSVDAVREALDDAVEVARASRIEWAKRERLNTILAQLSDGVIAVDRNECVQTLNPAMAQWLGIEVGAWQGLTLSEVCPELGLKQTLRLGTADLERIEKVKGKTLIANRMPILEQGVLTGAVLACQDPISIQRVDRHIRMRIKPHAESQRYELSQWVGSSAVVQSVRDQAWHYAASASTVLLLGESGTGKEVLAQGIHMASDRRDMPFVAVNCAAVSESLLESELFGYEDGAFTGARRGGKVGLFEAAHKGTIFLDEIGDLPLALQTRLLRVLQEREVLRVGATEPTPIQVRVIAATHRDLMAHVRQGLFRQDLYYRINILRLEVPPLRAHLSDLRELAESLWAKACEGQGWRAAQQVAMRPLLDALVDVGQWHDWPGNVRELENLIERVVASTQTAHVEGSVAPITPEQAHACLRRWAPELFLHREKDDTSLPKPHPFVMPKQAGENHGHESAQAAEQTRLSEALAQCQGDRAQAAAMLGISRTTLWRKLKQHGLA